MCGVWTTHTQKRVVVSCCAERTEQCCATTPHRNSHSFPIPIPLSFPPFAPPVVASPRCAAVFLVSPACVCVCEGRCAGEEEKGGEGGAGLSSCLGITSTPHSTQHRKRKRERTQQNACARVCHHDHTMMLSLCVCVLCCGVCCRQRVVAFVCRPTTTCNA